MASKLGKRLHVTNRLQWRQWLAKHYKTEDEIWLTYFKKRSGQVRVEYNDAVEEALCFGWIDSTVKKIDEDRFAQRFSRRKPGSPYSPANIERLRSLVRQRKVRKDVQSTLPDLTERAFLIPDDILKAIKANKEALKAFDGFSDAYKRIRIGFIEGARNRPDEFKKRLNYFIKMTARNKQFGYGGIEKYY